MRQERRRDGRFYPPKVKVTSGELQIRLSNLGRAGMKLAVYRAAPIACGSTIPFQLDDGVNVVRLLGEVKWVESAAAGAGPEAARMQAIGVVFHECLSEERLGIWKDLVFEADRILRPKVEPSPEAPAPEPIDEATDETPLIVMTEPADGTTVHTPSVEVTGEVDESRGVVSITINRVPATRQDGKFSCVVRLKSGDNKIVATVHKESGGYNTCLLGTLRLDPQWKSGRRR